MTIFSQNKPELMNLGNFQFEVNTAAYQALRRNTDYRWAKQDRLTRTPARQFIGKGDDKITLSGRIYPAHAGGLGQLDQMRAMGDSSTPLMLIDGGGKVYGKFVILKVTEMQVNFIAGGKPRRQDFTLEIAAYGDDHTSGGSGGGNNDSGGGTSIWDLIGEVGDFFDNLNSNVA